MSEFVPHTKKLVFGFILVGALVPVVVAVAGAALHAVGKVPNLEPLLTACPSLVMLMGAEGVTASGMLGLWCVIVAANALWYAILGLLIACVWKALQRR